MESKKTKRADLEKGKSVNFMIGLVVALAILLTAFEWNGKATDVWQALPNLVFTDEIDLPITREEIPEPPKPEQLLKTPDILNVIEDSQETEGAIISSEDLPDIAQPQPIPVGEEEKETADDLEIHIVVEKMPEFPGGETALLKWINENIKYPAIAAENGIEGRVACSFVINADGSISDVSILRPIDPNLDREAIRVLKSMPKWNPGMQQGKAVRVKCSIPVRFKLQK